MIPETVPAANPLILALAGGFESVTSTSTGAGSVSLPFIYLLRRTCQAIARRGDRGKERSLVKQAKYSMTPYVNLKGDFRKHWETYSGTLEENSGPFANQRRAWKQLLLNYEQYLDNRGAPGVGNFVSTSSLNAAIEGYQGQAGTYFNPVDERLASCRRDHHGQESPIYYSLHATLIMRRALQIVQGHYNGTADLGGRFPERLHSLLDPLNAMASNYTSVLAACREDGLDLRALLAKASDLAQHQDNLFSAKWTDLCEYKEVMAQVQELGDQHDAVLAQICEAKQVHEFRTGWCMHGLGIDALFGYMGPLQSSHFLRLHRFQINISNGWRQISTQTQSTKSFSSPICPPRFCFRLLTIWTPLIESGSHKSARGYVQ